MGIDIAKAALAAGHAVVATGRNPKKVTEAIGTHDSLLIVKLDVTSPEDAHAAVDTAVEKFGKVDVVVNNAGNFFAGFFEELSPEQIRGQIETLLFGPMNVTRAVLPVMRKQGGDPAKLARAIVQIAGLSEPPSRFAAGADAVQTFEAKANTLLAQAGAHRALSSSLSYDKA